MKRNIKNILMLVFSLVLALTFAVGCGPKKVLTLSETSCTVVAYEDYTLTCETENITEPVTWTSSNDAVASVANGVVTAKKAGTATITATAEGVSATCEVTVTASEYAPELTACEYDSITILGNEKYQLEPTVTYKDVAQQVTFTYESSEQAVATVSNEGEIVAVADGTTTITVKSNFKGTELVKTLVVTVQSTVSGVVVNGDQPISNNAVELFVEDTITLGVNTFFNEVADNEVTVAWSSEDAAITLNPVEKTVEITGVAAGEATLTLVLAKGEITSEITINVTVARKVVNDNTSILIDQRKGEIKLPTAVVASNIETVMLGDVQKEVTANNPAENTITIDVSDVAVGETELKFETETCVYSFADTVVASVVVMNANDLLLLNADMKAKTTSGKYYVLGADIDCTSIGAAGASTGWSAGWYGSGSTCFVKFDGRGHKISNLDAGHFGFFGADFAGEAKNTYFQIKINGRGLGGALCRINVGKIENCFVDLTVYNGNDPEAAGLVGANNTVGNNLGTIKNVILNLTSYTSTVSDFKAMAYKHKEAEGAVIENCYAISSHSAAAYGDASGANVATTGLLYATSTDFFTAVTELPVANGWNEMWSLANGELFFNGVKVM